MCSVSLRFLEEALATLKAAWAVEPTMLASNMLSASSKPLKIHSQVEALDFTKQFTSSNLRLEILGLLMTIAGLAAFKLPANITLLTTRTPSKADRQLFATNVLSVSDELINLCSRRFGTNDIMIWLRSENLRFTRDLRGKLDHHIWRISGQYFNDLLFLNFHRERGDNSGVIPLFLDEIRSQIFASAYRVDKDLSAGFSKPPRLPLHYCDRKLPLHLGPEDLLVPSRTLRGMISALGDDGWSVTPQLNSVGWLRARRIFSRFREEVLFIELGPANPKNEAALRNVIERVQTAWSAFPDYLHYQQNCWNTNLSSNTCFMVLVVYLEYLDLLFRIEKLIHSFTQGDDTALVAAAASLFTTTISSAHHFSRNSGAYSDYVWSLLFYELPSATVLAMALNKSAQLGPKVGSIPWTDLYRQVSVLASIVEGVVESGDGNSLLYGDKCKDLLKMLGGPQCSDKPAYSAAKRNTSSNQRCRVWLGLWPGLCIYCCGR